MIHGMCNKETRAQRWAMVRSQEILLNYIYISITKKVVGGKDDCEKAIGDRLFQDP